MCRKKTLLICQYSKCHRPYEAFRVDSKHCCKAHRTAAYRERLKAKEKFQSLSVYNPRHTNKVCEIKRALISQLKFILEFDKAGMMPLVTAKALDDKMNLTITTWHDMNIKALQDQIEWIWMHVESFLMRLIDDSKKAEKDICVFRLTSEIRDGIYKLIK